MVFSAVATALRSFHDAKSMELRIRCTMQVCTIVCGNTALIASGKPFRPSTTAMSTSSTPRFFSSFIASGAGAQGGSTPPVLNRLRVALEPDWHPELPQGLDACRDLARCVLDEVCRFRSHRRRKEQPAAGVD